MGQTGSRESRVEQRELNDGVRITEDLLLQIAGSRPARQKASSSSNNTTGNNKSRPGPSSLPQLLRGQGTDGDMAAAIIRKNEMISRALKGSHRVGDLLLKAEAEETQRIEELANELIEREFNAPNRDLPCQREADACLECYKENCEDPSKCAEAAAAYSQCSKEAWTSVLQKG